MADVPVKQVYENGPRNYRALYTLVSDGSGFTNYLAADPTSADDMGVNIQGNTLYPLTHLKIWKMRYDISDGFGLRLIWDASVAQDAYIINGAGAGKQDFMKLGGLSPYSAGTLITGATGKILFSTTGGPPPPGGFFSLDLWLKKDIHQ